VKAEAHRIARDDPVKPKETVVNHKHGLVRSTDHVSHRQVSCHAAVKTKAYS
jgi:hypothetical protein